MYEVINVNEKVSLINVKLSSPITPKDISNVLKELAIATTEALGKEVVAISGRMPMWLMGAIVHELVHKFPAIGVFDPKLKGIVIVATHNPNYEVGQVIQLNEEIIKKVMQ